jgi:hypothetical protein
LLKYIEHTSPKRFDPIQNNILREQDMFLVETK